MYLLKKKMIGPMLQAINNTTTVACMVRRYQGNAVAQALALLPLTQENKGTNPVMHVDGQL